MEPSKTKRQLQAEQTKDRLFDAAVSLLREKDFEDITVREIVSRAQVSVGTFYKYYSTKMEVFYETYRIADQYFVDTVAPTMTQPTAHARIMAFFSAYARYNDEFTDRKMTKLLYNPDNPFFNRSNDHGMLDTLIHAIRFGLSRGELTGSDTAEEIAEYLMIAIRGLIYHWCTMQYSYDLREAVDKFALRLLRAYE